MKVQSDLLKIGTFVDEVLKDWLGVDWDISVVEGSRILYDPDFEDNLGKTFKELDIGQGNHLQINDEDGLKMPVIFILGR